MNRKFSLVALTLLGLSIPNVSRAEEEGPILCDIILRFSEMIDGREEGAMADGDKGCPKEGRVITIEPCVPPPGMWVCVLEP